MEAPYAHLTKGSLLIASPDLNLGIYFRAVIVLCEHSQTGSFGLVINKDLEVELPEEIINLKEVTNPNVHICEGGPMQQNQMMLLHSSDQIPDQTLKICDGVYLGGDLQFLQEALHAPNGPHLKLCFGFAGWNTGQLEREFLNGDWFLYPGSERLIFEIPSEKIWQTVLREMGGKYATLSMIPEDLSLN